MRFWKTWKMADPDIDALKKMWPTGHASQNRLVVTHALSLERRGLITNVDPHLGEHYEITTKGEAFLLTRALAEAFTRPE